AAGDLTAGTPLGHPSTWVRWSEQAGHHLFRLVGEDLLLAAQVRLPGRGLPDLDALTGADDGAVPLEARIRPQHGRDRDPALLVEHLVTRTGEEDTQVVAGLLARH